MTPKENSRPANVQTLLRNLSQKDFRELGVQHIAYIRPVRREENQIAYSIHAADGNLLSVMDSLHEAAIAARLNDLEPVTLH